MSKRRMFDINFPGGEDAPTASVPAGTDHAPAPEPRRGPMATAISENADALRERAAAEQKIREENDRLAHEHVRLKKQGLITDLIPIERIRTSKLTRDRSAAVDPDLEELKESIRSIGLSNPIRVEVDGDGYQLVQGFRRLSAYRALYEEEQDGAYAKIPAGFVATGEALEGLYRRMVDENLVRRDLSFAEMARLVLAYVRDPETAATSIEEAVRALYASANRQKRSYIAHFAILLQAIGDLLNFPEALPRALGLKVEKRLSEDMISHSELRTRLEAAKPTTAEAELAVLKQFAEAAGQGGSKPAKPATVTAKTTLKCTVPAGTVRCSARNGKVELAMERDFSGIDRHRLEEAVKAFMAALEE